MANATMEHALKQIAQTLNASTPHVAMQAVAVKELVSRVTVLNQIARMLNVNMASAVMQVDAAIELVKAVIALNQIATIQNAKRRVYLVSLE